MGHLVPLSIVYSERNKFINYKFCVDLELEQYGLPFVITFHHTRSLVKSSLTHNRFRKTRSFN